MWNSLRLAFRNLKRNGLYSWINIAGLAVSLIVCILLALWIQDELSFDRFNKKAKNIYLVHADQGNDVYWRSTPAPMASVAKNKNADILEVCRMGGYWKGYFEYQGNKFSSFQGLAVDSTFFDMFDFPLINGDKERLFPDDLSMLISESMAKAIFGKEDVIGKTLRSNDDMLFHITGIMKDAPKNSSINFDFLVPFDVQQKTFAGNGQWKYINEDWGSYFYFTYFLLRDGTDSKTISRQVSEEVTAIRDGHPTDFLLQPLLKVHLYKADGESAGIKTVRLFMIITILILLIACINYVNLVTARAAKRSREMAVRKIMGGNRSKLFSQLMKETLLLLFLSFIIATIIIHFVIPFYNRFTGREMLFSITNPYIWLIYGIMALTVIVLAGLYPAFFIASFKPVDAFKEGATSKKGGGLLRKVLVIVQFVASFVLIVATIGMSLQMKYMREKDLGYDQENVFTVFAGAMANQYPAIKNELLSNKDILAVTAADHNMMIANNSRCGISWPGKQDDFHPVFDYTVVQYDFYETMDVELLSGSFSTALDSSFTILVNEEAVRVMGMDDPIGQPFYINDSDYGIIKGIIKNYHFHSLSEKIKPLFVMNYPGIAHVLYIKTTSAGAKNAIEAVEKLWKQYNPDYEFSYSFLDENFERTYRSNIMTGKLLLFFSIIAIVISCLGLFGLVTYTAQVKTKEIGIRKVLGASIVNIVNMLAAEFLILIGIAVLIAFPLSYYGLHLILQDFPYRITVPWWIFLLSASVTLILTLLTVSFQAIKSAMANPVNSIKV